MIFYHIESMFGHKYNMPICHELKLDFLHAKELISTCDCEEWAFSLPHLSGIKKSSQVVLYSI